jgi:putative transposase
MQLYQNKYKIQSLRHKNWDYSQNGYYFVTICTKDMQEFFGEVVDGKMKLSEIGKIVEKEWLNTAKVRDNVKVDQFIIMPNHLHGIIVIENRRDASHASQNTLQSSAPQSRRLQGVSTDENYKNKFGPQSNNLSAIIRGFKGASTKRIREILPSFQWQSRFYDRIIRDETALGKIREYIERNPKFWDEEKNKVENIFY